MLHNIKDLESFLNIINSKAEFDIDSFHANESQIVQFEIFANISHVSSSGMLRHISLYILVDGKLYRMNNFLASFLNYKQNKQSYALIVKGCGMDMVFSVLHDLQSALKSLGHHVDCTRYDFIS